MTVTFKENKNVYKRESNIKRTFNRFRSRDCFNLFNNRNNRMDKLTILLWCVFLVHLSVCLYMVLGAIL